MAPWLKRKVVILLIAAVVVVSVLSIGWVRQKRETARLIDSLQDKALSPMGSATVDLQSLGKVPEPVARYFRYALPDGQRKIQLARFHQTGELRSAPDSDQWLRFAATQLISARPRAFLWDAKITLAPGIHIRVRDAYLHGAGSGKVSLLSAMTMGYDRNKPELNSAALYRYLAEAVWYPTALLPESGVQWQAIDEHHALAKLTDSNISVALEFRFNHVGEITGIYTEDRYGKFNGQYEKHPWEGHFNNYQIFDGVKIPTEAEVGWHLPVGWWLFWKGRISDARFEYAAKRD